MWPGLSWDLAPVFTASAYPDMAEVNSGASPALRWLSPWCQRWAKSDAFWRVERAKETVDGLFTFWGGGCVSVNRPWRHIYVREPWKGLFCSLKVRLEPNTWGGTVRLSFSHKMKLGNSCGSDLLMQLHCMRQTYWVTSGAWTGADCAVWRAGCAFTASASVELFWFFCVRVRLPENQRIMCLWEKTPTAVFSTGRKRLPPCGQWKASSLLWQPDSWTIKAVHFPDDKRGSSLKMWHSENW